MGIQIYQRWFVSGDLGISQHLKSKGASDGLVIGTPFKPSMEFSASNMTTIQWKFRSQMISLTNGPHLPCHCEPNDLKLMLGVRNSVHVIPVYIHTYITLHYITLHCIALGLPHCTHIPEAEFWVALSHCIGKRGEANSPTITLCCLCWVRFTFQGTYRSRAMCGWSRLKKTSSSPCRRCLSDNLIAWGGRKDNSTVWYDAKPVHHSFVQ